MKKYQYFAVMLDETGVEFGAEIEAANLKAAEKELAREHPEAKVSQKPVRIE